MRATACLLFLFLQFTRSCVNDGNQTSSDSQDGSITLEFHFSSIEDLERQLTENPALQNYLENHLESGISTSECGSTGPTEITTSIEISGETTVNSPTTTTRYKSSVSSTHTRTSSSVTDPVTTTSPDTTTPSVTTAKPSCEEKYPTPSVPFTTTNSDEACFSGKCFRVEPRKNDFSNVDFMKAKMSCESIGWNLANIYDECYFDVISEYLKEKSGEVKLWTGMTITPQNGTVYLRSGEEAKWMVQWYGRGENPKPNSGQTNLQTRHTSTTEPGVQNASPSTKTHGALCEK